ncbi:hypothetical protein EPN15_01735 [Patescibacteria group bacterium]|nr:MAG: hypothetical protein EPN15_01735 [Patescibacteria group bacterium]
MFDLSIGMILGKIKKPGYLNDSILFWCFVASIFLLALALGAIEFLLPKDLDFISLHYNIYTGIDRAGLRSEMLYYVLAALIFFAINAFFSARFFKKGDIFISRLVAGFNAGIMTLFAFAIFYIIFLNR